MIWYDIRCYDIWIWYDDMIWYDINKIYVMIYEYDMMFRYDIRYMLWYMNDMIFDIMIWFDDVWLDMTINENMIWWYQDIGYGMI